ncbi:NYAP1 kinase, partial [Piaya cayana]|nr:NYAP1 kinase [Piaya cayana]
MSGPPRSELVAPLPAMSLLQRKGRPPRDEEPRKGTSKTREGGSLRRPLRVGFLTLPAPQERGPRPCPPGMAPRSLSCHAVGLPESAGGGAPRAPPPRLGPLEGRGLEAPPAKRGGAPRGGCTRQTPPPKPSRSPQTRLSAPPAPESEAEEPVYIEMVGDARRGEGAPPEPPQEEPEAIYEEMSCPLPAGDGAGHAPFLAGHAPFLAGHAHSPFIPFGHAHSHSAGHAPSAHSHQGGHAPSIHSHGSAHAPSA